MLAVEKWAEGKSPVIAVYAPQVASTAQDIHEAFVDIKNRRLYDYQFELPHLPTWFKLYRSHRKSSHFIKELVGDHSSFGTEMLSVAEDMGDLGQYLKKSGIAELKKELSQLTPQELLEVVGVAKDLCGGFVTQSFNDINAEINDDAVDPEEREVFLEKMGVVEAGFYYLVAIPCWVLYQEYPTRLYRKARLGDCASLEKLIRLDPLIIHDPSIGKQVQALRLLNKRSAYGLLIDAIHKKPKPKINRKKIKYAFAGYISAFSAAVKAPLDEPQIRALFDAVAQDYLKKPIDTDLPNSPETFSKAIQRNRKPWQAVFSPDIKK